MKINNLTLYLDKVRSSWLVCLYFLQLLSLLPDQDHYSWNLKLILVKDFLRNFFAIQAIILKDDLFEPKTYMKVGQVDHFTQAFTDSDCSIFRYLILPNILKLKYFKKLKKKWWREFELISQRQSFLLKYDTKSI